MLFALVSLEDEQGDFTDEFGAHEVVFEIKLFVVKGR
jgi:hypothetical protein